MAVYRITGFTGYKELKHGGSSTILSAERTKDNKIFAIKMITPEALQDKDQYRAFIQEAEIMKELKCRSIVRAFEILEDAQPRPAIVLELLEGKNLKVLMKTDIEFVYEHWHKIIYEIAGALMYIHKRGIIHRDIKPENIIVDADGMAKLTDFSLAITKTKKPRKIQGTLLYISPEQIQKKKLTVATDIYSFGVTMYEMFVNEPPFKEPGVLDKHLSAVPESLNKIAPSDLSKELASYIMRMLQKDPESRPQDMKDLLGLLKQIDSDPIVDDRQDAQRERRRRKKKQEEQIEESEESKVSTKQQSELLLRAVRKKQLEDAMVKEREDRIQSEVMAGKESSGFTPSYKETKPVEKITEPVEVKSLDDNEYKQQLSALSDNYDELHGKFDFEQDTQV